MIVERMLPITEKSIHNYSSAVDINGLTVYLGDKLFRCHIDKRSTLLSKSFHIGFTKFSTQSKIRHFYGFKIVWVIDQYVFGFKVSMNNILIMNIL